MPTAPPPPPSPGQSNSDVVDLTSSPVMSTRSRKRSAAHISSGASADPSTPTTAAEATTTRQAGTSTKRRRTTHGEEPAGHSHTVESGPSSSGSSSTNVPARPPRLPAEISVEEIDLVDDEDPLSTTLQRQREQQIKEQSRSQGGGGGGGGGSGSGSGADDKESKLNNLTCAICLEPPTDLTATTCGHLFCHECLFSSLVAGERSSSGESRKSSCPICRKTVSRKKATDVIPLIMMTRGVLKDKGKARQPEVQQQQQHVAGSGGTTVV